MTTSESQVVDLKEKLLISFARQTTAHGFSRLNNGPLLQRCFWLVIILLSTGGFLQHLWELVERYRSFPINTEIIEGEKKFVFPDVTICPNNFLSWDYAYNNVWSKHSIFNWSLNAMVYDIARVWHKMKNESNDAPRFPWSSFWDSRLSMKQLAYRGFAFQQAHDTIIFCRFNSELCSYRNFSLYKDETRFACFRFRPHNTSVVSTGEKSGLYLVLHGNYKAFLTEEEEVENVPGFSVTLHDKGTKADFSKSFQVPLQYKTSAAIAMTTHSKLNRTSNPCYELSNVEYLVDYSHPENLETQIFSGSNEDCQIAAMQQDFLKECHCLGDHLLIPANLMNLATPCHTLYEKIYFRDIKVASDKKSYVIQNNSISNWMQLHDFLYVENLDKFNDTQRRILCFNKVAERHTLQGVSNTYCPAKCKTNKYALQVSSTRWPRNLERSTNAFNLFLDNLKELVIQDNLTLQILKTFERNITTRIEDNVAVLDLYPTSTKATYLREDWAYPLRNLFSDLGGILGLWVGVSVITLMEFVELFCQLPWLFLKRMQWRNTQTVTFGDTKPKVTEVKQETVDNQNNVELKTTGSEQTADNHENPIRSTQYTSTFSSAQTDFVTVTTGVSNGYVYDSVHFPAVQSKKSWMQRLFSV